MATNFKAVAGNTAPAYSITCQRDGTVMDLSAATGVTLIIKNKGTGVITQAGKAATITAATTGVISYTADASDFPVAGTYAADIKVTYSGGFEILYRQATWKIRNPIS